MPLHRPATSTWLRWAVHLILGLSVGHALVMVTRLPGWCLPLPALVWCALAGWKRWGAPPPPRLRVQVLPWAPYSQPSGPQQSEFTAAWASSRVCHSVGILLCVRSCDILFEKNVMIWCSAKTFIKKSFPRN